MTLYLTLALAFFNFRFRQPVRFPPVALPLALFFMATVISVSFVAAYTRSMWMPAALNGGFLV